MKSALWTLPLALAFLAGCQASADPLAPRPMTPVTAPSADLPPAASEADKAFIDGMVPHHQMALVMADDALDKATHQELKDFANQVNADQAREIAEMKAWRETWFGSSATPAMAHGAYQAIAAGPAYDRQWAEEMIVHHQGAVDMAKQALAQATRPEVKALAQRIIDAQQQEQVQLRAWSKAWGG